MHYASKVQRNYLEGEFIVLWNPIVMVDHQILCYINIFVLEVGNFYWSGDNIHHVYFWLCNDQSNMNQNCSLDFIENVSLLLALLLPVFPLFVHTQRKVNRK